MFPWKTYLNKLTPATATAVNPPRMIDQGAPFSFADLVERVSPAVVTILVDREVRVGGNRFRRWRRCAATAADLPEFLAYQFGGRSKT